MDIKLKNWEGWHFHHLARRAKTFGLEYKIINTLEKAGWLLTKKGYIPKDSKSDLVNALTRIASIRDFEKNCDRLDCFICKRVVEEFFTGEYYDIPWKLSIELYRWQKEAKNIWWENGGKGMVKVVTGAGKTIFALSLISDLFNSEAYKDGGLKILIVVPTIVLLDQWLIDILDKLHIPKEKVGVFYGKEKDKIEDKDILLYVINSARNYLLKHYEKSLKGNDLFLIADECHRYGSKENSRIFEIPFSFTLGLSATPERYGDYGFENKLVPNLGKVIYTYTYSDALKDGIIPPYKIIRVKVNLSLKEQEQYAEITEKINKMGKFLLSKYPKLQVVPFFDFIRYLNLLYEKTKDDLIKNYIILLNKRKEIIHLSKSKLDALKWLFKEERLEKEKVLIFHERIEIAEQIYEFLNNKYNVGIYHSKMNIKDRLKNISNFKDNIINILIACRALDEGFDVPAAETGIIVAGTSSVRQWIQRIGRILRRCPSKEYSKVYVIFADIVEDDVFNKKDLADFEKEALSVELINLKRTPLFKRSNTRKDI